MLSPHAYSTTAFIIKQMLNSVFECVKTIYTNVDICIDIIKRLLYNIDCKKEQVRLPKQKEDPT